MLSSCCGFAIDDNNTIAPMNQLRDARRCLTMAVQPSTQSPQLA